MSSTLVYCIMGMIFQPIISIIAILYKNYDLLHRKISSNFPFAAECSTQEHRDQDVFTRNSAPDSSFPGKSSARRVVQSTPDIISVRNSYWNEEVARIEQPIEICKESDSDDDFSIRPIRDLNFNRIREIGHGYEGSIYLVADVSGQVFAEKIVRNVSSSQVQLLQFAKDNISHPNIIKIHELTVESDKLHEITDFFPDGDLFESAIEGQNKLTDAEICTMMIQLCDAVAYLHQRKMMHRDIKPENLLLRGKDIVLADLGFLVRFEGEEFSTAKLGTVDYVSPEFHQEEPYSYPHDVWAIGCMMAELLTGLHPFSIPNVLEAELEFAEKVKIVRSKVLHDGPSKGKREHSETLWNLAMEALEKNPELRITAKDLEQELRNALKDLNSTL